MTFTEAIRSVLNKYFVFQGRARRAEYWWFALFGFLGNFVAAFVDAFLFGAPDFQPASTLFSLAILIPSIAVGVRRLHDRDMSGWWLLLAFVPLLGAIALLVLFCLPGTDGSNRFGPDPIRTRDDSRHQNDDDNTSYSPSSIPRVDRE